MCSRWQDVTAPLLLGPGPWLSLSALAGAVHRLCLACDALCTAPRCAASMRSASVSRNMVLALHSDCSMTEHKSMALGTESTQPSSILHVCMVELV